MVRIKGLDKVKRELRSLQNKVEKASSTSAVSLNEIITPEFLSRFTNFTSVEDMIQKSGFSVGSQEDFERIPEVEWDQFISTNTQFSTWKDMLNQAGQEYFLRRFENA